MEVKNLVLGIGIVVVYALVLWQGIEAFYPSPQYNDFCGTYPEAPIKQYAVEISNCTFPRQLQEYSDQCSREEGFAVYNYDENGCVSSFKECDFCNKQFTEAQNSHSKNVFWVSVIVGIITLLVGYLILNIEPVGSSLIGSSIWAIFYGTVVNWRNFTTILRFLLLLIVLILLIWIAIKLNTQKKTFLNEVKSKNKPKR
jgi:hypothetical protein